MFFSKKLENKITDIKTKYDLAAFCYYYLVKTINNQIIFLGEYIEINGNAEINNPNFQLLCQLSVNIKKLLKKYPSDISFFEILNLVSSTEKSLEVFGDETMNNATIPFFILKGFDLYFQDCTYETYTTSPLNNYCKEFCLIYINSNLSIMDEILIKRDYAGIIKKNEIRSYFSYIIILEKCELPRGYGIPKLIALKKNEKSLEKILKTNKLNIALIPTTCDKCFEFYMRKGASFEIKYDEYAMQNVKKKVIALLNWAIECKANIIIFPEYICSEEIQTTISKTLLQMSLSEPEKLNELLFVVSGSGWTKDSNNVSCLYDEEGILLGKVYKYSAYDNDKNGNKYVERLQNPGKEITLIKIPRIGIFQIEICRNVSENEFCLKMAKIFDTQFLLISAYSSSVNIGFKKQIDSIVSSNHKTCSVMCNCCAAFSENEKFREHIGIISAPQKKGSLIEANFEYVERKKKQCDKCCDNGCFFEICYDFNGEEEKDVEIKSIFRKKP